MNSKINDLTDRMLLNDDCLAIKRHLEYHKPRHYVEIFHDSNSETLKCECGILKTYGPDADPSFHSDYCPMSRNCK